MNRYSSTERAKGRKNPKRNQRASRVPLLQERFQNRGMMYPESLWVFQRRAKGSYGQAGGAEDTPLKAPEDIP